MKSETQFFHNRFIDTSSIQWADFSKNYVGYEVNAAETTSASYNIKPMSY